MTTEAVSAFEEIRSTVASLPVPGEEQSRSTFWITSRRLGIARTFASRLEIFLGARVKARLPLVAKHLQHNDWKPEGGGEAFTASMIVLPEGQHFEPIASVIAVELLRQNDLATDTGMQEAFSAVEPIIDLALKNVALAEGWTLGLLGELLILEQALASAGERQVAASKVLSSWHGFEHGERDFLFGTLAIEIKTTSGAAARHHISSLHQIEPTQLGTGALEDLRLLSVGLVPTPSNGHSIASVAERITSLLDAAGEGGLRAIFLESLARYGGKTNSGYNHISMKSWPIFNQEFAVSYSPRLYDMCDADMKLIRRLDLQGTFVDQSEIQYAISLPEKLNDKNPTMAWQRAIIEALT